MSSCQMHSVSRYSEIFNTFPEDRNGGGAYTADAIMKDTENGKGTSWVPGSQYWRAILTMWNADNFVRVSTYGFFG